MYYIVYKYKSGKEVRTTLAMHAELNDIVNATETIINSKSEYTVRDLNGKKHFVGMYLLNEIVIEDGANKKGTITMKVNK